MKKRKQGKALRQAQGPGEVSDFGKKLQAARLKADLSQREVAQRVGITVTTVSRYEITSVLPNVVMAAQLAHAVGVSLDQLTGLAEADTELVELARKLAGVLAAEQQKTVGAQLQLLLELAGRK